MKHCNKILPLILLCLLMMLTACHGETPADPPPAEDVINGPWEVDKDNHWHLTESGEAADVAAHTLADNFCTICSAEIYTYEDGSADVYVNNEQGDFVLYIWYDSEGSETKYTREYTYDDNGNMLKYKEFVNNKLTTEREYTFDGDFSYETKYTEYNEVGARLSCEYNQYGDPISEISFDENGNAVQTLTYDITYDADSRKTETKTYRDGILIMQTHYTTISVDDVLMTYTSKNTTYNEDGTKHVEEYNEHSDRIAEISYDADGNIVYEYTYTYEYNENRYISAAKKYNAQTLLEEYFYTTIEDFTYLSKEIVYNEDGTQVVTEYDERGHVIE